MKNMIKEWHYKLSAKRFGRLYNKAVRNLGEIEYATMEFKKSVATEMNNIKRVRKQYINSLIISFIISFVTSLLVTIIF
jgi:hypothetical protein